MKLDTIGRRKSNTVQSTGKEVRVQPYDYDLLEGLRRHSPIPTAIAQLFWKRDGLLPSFQDRAKWLTHESRVFVDGHEIEGPLLVRPWELNPPPPNPEPAWYEASEMGLKLVPTEAPSIPRRDDKRHRGMGACVTASFDLDASEHGMTFIHHEDMLLHERCPMETRTSWNPLEVEVSGGKYEPDALFGFEYPDRFMWFVAEFDRGGVPNTRSDKKQTTNFEKLDAILALLASKAYQRRWGVLSLNAMFITTLPGRIERCLAHIKGKPHAEKILFKALPQFHRKSWKAPRATLKELFEPWQSAAGPRDITKP